MAQRTKANPEMFNGWHEINGRMVLLENGYVIRQKAKPMLTAGYYINLWNIDGEYDVFIILNEANDEPTVNEISMIEDAIRPVCEDNSVENKKEKMQEILDDLGLNCLDFGCQVIINK